MPNTNDLWERLAAQSRRNPASEPQPAPWLVSRIVGQWRLTRQREASEGDAWQCLGFRAALAAGIVMLTALLVSGPAISEALGQGLSFLPEVSQVEVFP
jgi:hypothetical protein